MTVMCSLDTDAAIQLADRGNSLVAHSVGDSIRTTNDSAAHNQMIKFEYVYSHRRGYRESFCSLPAKPYPFFLPNFTNVRTF